MIEVLLFLGVLCLLFFVPVYFEISYRKLALDDHMVLEMRFLYGLLRRRREISFFKPVPFTPLKEERFSGRWFFWHKKTKTRITGNTISDSSHSWKSFWRRMHHFGLGVTLLSYFLPANYQSWLLVVEDLEHKGRFQEFSWALRIGTGDAAGTAILYGVLKGANGLLVNWLQSRIRFDTPPKLILVPSFEKASLDTFFHCIFRVKLGHIIIAAIGARLQHRFLKGGASH